MEEVVSNAEAFSYPFYPSYAYSSTITWSVIYVLFPSRFKNIINPRLLHLINNSPHPHHHHHLNHLCQLKNLNHFKYQSSISIRHTVINREVRKLISGIFKNNSRAKTIILPERYRYYHLSHRHFYYHPHHHMQDQYFIIFNLITLLMMVHKIVIS